MVEASNPILCDKIKYWEDKSFAQRLINPPPIPKLLFKNEIIPRFDIPDPSQINEMEIDPNQIDFLSDSSNEDEDLLPDIFQDDDENEDLLDNPPKEGHN